jgi:hypothetical protein|tara:strand:- start:4662 stop:5708 length:1047 start_codon:yes stop_codon:yes gene_type:complete
MTKPVLTRYLYLLDEVILSLQQSILQKKGFDECIFWVGELYFSKYYDKLWFNIFKFYYNFCAIQYPKYEKKLTSLFKKSTKQNELKNVLNAVYLLYYSKYTFDVFKLSNIQPVHPNKIYLKTPKWLKDLKIDKKYYNFILSVHKNHKINISFYINKFENVDELYEIIKKYYKTTLNMSLNSIPYSNKKHILFATIIYLIQEIDIIQKKNVFRKYDHVEDIKQLMKDNDAFAPLYRTLLVKLRYPINKNIGCYNLKRYNCSMGINKMLWYHWEYFAYSCPLWRERFDAYDIEINHKSKTIEFINEDEEEEFYETHSYEFDEQSLITQNKIIENIPKNSIFDMINSFKKN